MADESSDRSAVTAPSRLVDHVSRLLDPDERDAVRGDLAELGLSPSQTLREVLGLVVRRQAALWKQWGPWLAFGCVAAPLGILLSHVSRDFADGSAIYAFLYFNNWTLGYLESPGARLDLVNTLTRVFLNGLALVGWSWACGFVMGALSRRTRWVAFTLFCLVLMAGSSWGATARANPFNAAVFSLTFYGVVYPWLVLIALVLTPAGYGMRRSCRPTALPLVLVILGAVAVVLLTAYSARGVKGGWTVHVERGPDGALRWPLQLQLLPVLLVWPVAYIVASACWGRWRGQSTSS